MYRNNIGSLNVKNKMEIIKQQNEYIDNPKFFYKINELTPDLEFIRYHIYKKGRNTIPPDALCKVKSLESYKEGNEVNGISITYYNMDKSNGTIREADVFKNREKTTPFATYGRSPSSMQAFAFKKCDKNIKNNSNNSKISLNIASPINFKDEFIKPYITDVDELYKKCKTKQIRLSVHVTGGGINTLKHLFTTPGASSVCMDASIPYNQYALAKLLGETGTFITGATSPIIAKQIAETAMANCLQDIVKYMYADYIFEKNIKNKPNVNSNSLKLVNNIRTKKNTSALTRQILDKNDIIGVSCTATLASSRESRSPNWAFISIASSNKKKTYTFVLILDKNCERTRQGQDEVCSQLILYLLNQYANGIDLASCGIEEISPAFNNYIKKNTGELNNSYKGNKIKGIAFTNLITKSKDSVFLFKVDNHSVNSESL